MSTGSKTLYYNAVEVIEQSRKSHSTLIVLAQWSLRLLVAITDGSRERFGVEYQAMVRGLLPFCCLVAVTAFVLNGDPRRLDLC